VAFINYSNGEVNCKLVYCGPGLSGKTTNILQIYRSVRPESRGRLISLYTETERTLYFDFLPIELGLVGGYRVRLHLYSVPGQVFYAATRRLVFRGVDGIVFVADSQIDRMDANYEALRDLRENLGHYGLELETVPYALQLNKRDLDDIHGVQFLTDELRLGGEPVYQAIAAENEGVRETLKDVARQLLFKLQADLTEVPAQ
jgi:mutual gliding-motility protein MglA